MRNFKKLIIFMVFLAVLSPVEISNWGFEPQASSAATKTKRAKKTNKSKSARKTKAGKSGSSTHVKVGSAELNRAMQLGKEGRYAEASVLLFKLSRSPRLASQRNQIKYLLGLMLFDMKLYQLAAFHFVDVVKEGNSLNIKKALEKLSLAADKLGDETLLNYAMSKVDLRDFPREHVDKLRYRIAEFQFQNEQYDKAAENFSKVKMESPLYSKAKYMEGLTWATLKRNDEAIKAFSDLVQYRADAKVTDPTRVAALMGLARAYYQKKDWENSILTYRKVPRDTESWHDVLFEMSWAQMRSAQFRSVLSNFHSLHSPYYEDFYIPESILLRSLVYLYICEYDEMEKTLDLFDRVYRPLRRSIRDYLKSEPSSEDHFKNMDEVVKHYDKIKSNMKARSKIKIPFMIARKIMKEGNFSKGYSYVYKLLEEKRRMEKMPASWQNSQLGVYSKKILANRLARAKENVGDRVEEHIKDARKELLELFKQKDFARFEMLSGKKEQLRKDAVTKEDLKSKHSNSDEEIDEDSDKESDQQRSYYIQNGYEYYPFQGEYWLDEIGNYYYLGKQRCE